MRRLLAITTSSFVLLPTLAAAIAAPLAVTVDGQSIVFQDVPSDAWYAADLEVAVLAGVVSGYKNTEGEFTGYYGPADNVTYAQAMKIAVEAAGYPVEEYAKSEMYPDHWASKYMQIGTEHKFVSTEGDAQPIDRPATRAEVALIIADAFDVEKGSMEDEHYTDVSDDTAHAYAIAGLTRDGVISGDKKANGELKYTFRPGSPVNRAETVKMAMTAWSEYGDRGEKLHPQEPGIHSTSSSAGAAMESHSSSSSAKNDNHSSSTSGATSTSSSSSAISEPHVVTYTDAGFSPSNTIIKSGESVTFRNESNAAMWVKSDAQQANDYSGFDAGVSVAKGGMYTFKFTKTGSWSFYNKVSSQNMGTVTVQE